MKKLFITLGVIVVLFVMCVVFGCEKPALSGENKSEGAKRTLRVNVFQIENTPFEDLTRGAVGDVCTRLNFVVYDMTGTRLRQVNQTSDNENFGSCSFQLEEGSYQLVVVGHSSGGNPTMTDPTCIKFTNSQGFSDTFLCNGNVTIGEEPVDFKVSLVRIASLCRFVINDDIPAGITKMRFYYTGGSGAFDASTGLGSVNSKQDVKFDVVSGQKQFDLYTFLHDVEGTIHLTVTALDGNGNELYNRVFDVPMRQNQITWLSGDFFNGAGSSPSVVSTIDVDTDWNGETHLTF